MNCGGAGGSIDSGGRKVAERLLARLKPYEQWAAGLSGEQAVQVLRVWGSAWACHEWMTDNLSGIAGLKPA